MDLLELTMGTDYRRAAWFMQRLTERTAQRLASSNSAACEGSGTIRRRRRDSAESVAPSFHFHSVHVPQSLWETRLSATLPQAPKPVVQRVGDSERALVLLADPTAAPCATFAIARVSARCELRALLPLVLEPARCEPGRSCLSGRALALGSDVANEALVGAEVAALRAWPAGLSFGGECRRKSCAIVAVGRRLNRFGER